MATKHLEVGEQRLLLRPFFIRGLVRILGARRETITKGLCSIYCFARVFNLQGFVFEHAPRTLDQSSVNPFGYAIKLRSVSRCEFLNDASVSAELGKLGRLVLATVVASKYLDSTAGLIFHQLYKYHEIVEDF